MKKCSLCLTNDADKRNSHIFPRFMGVSLLTTSDNKRKGYTVGGTTDVSRLKPDQDTPKEDHILCSSCESKIGQLETILANELINILKNPSHSHKFTHIKFNGFNKTFIPTINNEDLKRVVLSMLLRAHISSLDPFNNLKLTEEQYERIRKILNHESPYEDIPMSIWTSGDSRFGENYYYGHSTSNQNTHILWVNDYIFVIVFDVETDSLKIFDQVLLRDEVEPFLGIVPSDQWDEWRKSLLKASIHFLKENETE